MRDMNDQEQMIRERIRRYIKNRSEFYVHLVVFISVNLLLWAIWFFTRDNPEVVAEIGEVPFPWPLIPMFGWGIGLVSHGLSVYFNSPARMAARENEIERQVERLYGSSKPKRDVRYGLSDDGELIEFEDETLEDEPKRKRHE